MDREDATEEEVLALMKERDGQETEEPEEEEAEEVESESEESESETEDEETEEEEPQGDDDSEVDWSTAPPALKSAYEKVRSEAEKWKRDHGSIQSKWTKASQSQKEFESIRERLEQRDQLLERFETMLENNPKLVELIQKENARKHDPFAAAEIPDYLKDDPAYKFLESAYKPIITNLQRELNEVKQKTSRFDEMDQKEAEGKRKAHLDTQLNSAREQIKSMFGREASEDEVTEVLQYMVDQKFYGNGKAAALAVFSDRYEQAILQKHQAQMKEKAKKFPSRNKSVPSARAVSSGQAENPHEAIAKALADQGF